MVQDLFLTETAKLANVVLPAQAAMEREGSLVSGERRVQLYPRRHCLFWARARLILRSPLPIAEQMGLTLQNGNASELFDILAAAEPSFSGLSYAKLAETDRTMAGHRSPRCLLQRQRGAK